MTEQKRCSSCKKQCPIEQFVNEGQKEFATCASCRSNRKSTKHNCETCGVKALYNVRGEAYGRFCNDHKEIGMIHV